MQYKGYRISTGQCHKRTINVYYDDKDDNDDDDDGRNVIDYK